MGVIEIAIIVAAGIFLLWLWRGGGQAAPVSAAPACAKASCGSPRALGCFGVLFALMIAAGMLLIGLRSHSYAGLGLALFAGMALLMFAGRWGRGVAVLGMFALVGLAVAGVGFLSVRMAQEKAHIAELENLVDDWLDGPAAELSPFHRARIERARNTVERKKAQAIEQLRRHAMQGRPQHGRFPLPADFSFEHESGATQRAGAILNIDLKPNVLSTGNVSPDALAATLLALVDLLATTDKPGEPSSVSLSTLYHVDVQSRNGQAIPLSQIAHLRKESRKGGGERIALISLKLSDKNKRPEQEQIRQVAKFLAGVELDRDSQRGHAGFQSSHSDSNLFISIEPALAVGIPVEAELAAAIPEAAPAPAVPSIAPAAPAPAPAPLPPEPAAPKPKLKSPIEGTVSDLLIAYQIMMWTLPESLGGAAEFKPVSQEIAVVATSAPAATEVAQAKPAEPVAVAAEAQPAPSTPPAAPQPAPPAVPPPPALVAEAVPAVRPKWLEGKAEYLDSHGDYFMRRSTGRLYQTADESHEAAAELLVEMTRDYVTSLLGKEAAAQVSIPIHTVLHDFVEATFDEQGPPPGLPDDDAWETHVLLKFDNTDRQLVEQAWRHSVVDRNLRYAGAGAGLLLALLGTVFGYLKVDTATRGYYSGRLKLATGAILAAITTLGILLVAGTLRL